MITKTSSFDHVTLKKAITPCRQELQSPNLNKGKFIIIKTDRLKCKIWAVHKARTIKEHCWPNCWFKNRNTRPQP